MIDILLIILSCILAVFATMVTMIGVGGILFFAAQIFYYCKDLLFSKGDTQ